MQQRAGISPRAGRHPRGDFIAGQLSGLRYSRHNQGSTGMKAQWHVGDLVQQIENEIAPAHVCQLMGQRREKVIRSYLVCEEALREEEDRVSESQGGRAEYFCTAEYGNPWD